MSIAAPATTRHRVAVAPRFRTLQIVTPHVVARLRGFQHSGFMSGIYPAYFRNKEPIPSLWNCFNVSGIVSVITQRLPQLANRHAEAAVKIDKRISRPEAAAKFLSADYFSRIFQQRDKEPTGLLLQPDASPVLQEFP